MTAKKKGFKVRMRTKSRPLPIKKDFPTNFVARRMARPGCPFCPGQYAADSEETPKLLRNWIGYGFRYLHGNDGAGAVATIVSSLVLWWLRVEKRAGSLNDAEIEYLVGLSEESDPIGDRRIPLKGALRSRRHSLRSLRAGILLWRKFLQQPYRLSMKKVRSIGYAMRFLREPRDFRRWVDALWNPCSAHVFTFKSKWAGWNSLGRGRPPGITKILKGEILAHPTPSVKKPGAEIAEVPASENPILALLEDPSVIPRAVLAKIRRMSKKRLSDEDKDALDKIERQFRERLDQQASMPVDLLDNTTRIQ